MTRAAQERIWVVRALIRRARGHETKTLGSWAKEYGLTAAERHGRVDEMDEAVCEKLIAALEEAKP